MCGGGSVGLGIGTVADNDFSTQSGILGTVGDGVFCYVGGFGTGSNDGI